MSQAEDIEAINKHIGDAPIKTPGGARLRDAWIVWHENLSWYDKHADSAVYDEARNRRNEFWKANAATPEEKRSAESHIKGGRSTEETQGEADRRLSSGQYHVEPPEEPPWIPTWVKVVASVTAVGAIGLFAYNLPNALVGGARKSVSDRLASMKSKIKEKL